MNTFQSIFCQQSFITKPIRDYCHSYVYIIFPFLSSERVINKEWINKELTLNYCHGLDMEVFVTLNKQSFPFQCSSHHRWREHTRLWLILKIRESMICVNFKLPTFQCANLPLKFGISSPPRFKIFPSQRLRHFHKNICLWVKMNAVAHAQLTFQILTLLQKYVCQLNIDAHLGIM